MKLKMIFFTKGRDTREGNDIEYDKSEKCAINTLNKKKREEEKSKINGKFNPGRSDIT